MMTEKVETYIGNVSESADLARRVLHARETGECWEVEIGLGNRAKGRILTQSASGQSVGIVKARDFHLRDGDVLLSERGYMVLVSLLPQRVMAIRFEAGANNKAISLLHLGHTLGNQHWPVTAQGDVLYVDIVTDAEAMKETLYKVAKTLAIEGLQVTFETKSAEKALDFTVGHAH